MSLGRRIGRSIRRLAVSPDENLYDDGRVRWFNLEDIDRICSLYYDETACGTLPEWQPWRDAHMRLPSWFVPNLDPLGDEYAAQQEKLWQVISGVDAKYNPAIHEREHDWGAVDPIRTPAYYTRRDSAAITSAADHILANGMLLKHCGVKAGDWALEYGAGFGQTALSLSRLGVIVDTVDISPLFCKFVAEQADFFRVHLHPFEGPFGYAPRPGHRYNLIWFYESFHHCVDFRRVVKLLPGLLADEGRVILGGEPVVIRQNDAVPYPWGIRLHSEVVATVRRQHWFELGFSEPFLLRLFASVGLRGRRIDCEPSLFGQLYLFESAASLDLTKA